MALNAWRCNPCGLNFPPRKAFDNCPVCGEDTKSTNQFTPMGDEEAQRFLRHHDFQLWCEENGRTEQDAPPLSRIRLPSDHTPHDGRIAGRMVEMLEEFSGSPVELHVFLTGLVSPTA